jgi:hypothetical protein
MKATLLAIGAGASFGLWSLIMSLTGLRAGGIAMLLIAGTFAVTAPWYLLIRPEPLLMTGRSATAALLVGLGAACLNGLGMIFLPPLLDAPPAVVGTRILIMNLTIVTVAAAWSILYGGQALTASKVVGVGLAVAAVWLLSR